VTPTAVNAEFHQPAPATLKNSDTLAENLAGGTRQARATTPYFFSEFTGTTPKGFSKKNLFPLDT
jgi:hypothetical protein